MLKEIQLKCFSSGITKCSHTSLKHVIPFNGLSQRQQQCYVRVFALVAFQGATLNGKNESGEFHACVAN